MIRNIWYWINRNIKKIGKYGNKLTILSICMLIVTTWGVIINIRNSNISEQQLKLVREQQEWLREEKNRKADLYLEVTQVDKETPRRVKLSFAIENRGNDIAEKWQFRIFLPDSLNPKTKKMTKYSSREGMFGFKYSYCNTFEKIIYYNTKAKLDCTLSFDIPKQFRGELIEIQYVIDYSRGVFDRNIIFRNPYIENNRVSNLFSKFLFLRGRGDITNEKEINQKFTNYE